MNFSSSFHLSKTTCMFIWMQYLTKNPPDKATCWLHLSLSKISLWIKEKLEDEAYVVFLCFGHLWKYHCVHKQGSSVPGPGVHSGKMYRREQSCYPWKVCKTTWSSLATMYGGFFSVLGLIESFIPYSPWFSGVDWIGRSAVLWFIHFPVHPKILVMLLFFIHSFIHCVFVILLDAW